MADVEKCVCCGEPIPEGLQVCPKCTMYHSSCLKCGYDWWSNEAFPTVCPNCKEYPYGSDEDIFMSIKGKVSEEVHKLAKMFRRDSQSEEQ